MPSTIACELVRRRHERRRDLQADAAQRAGDDPVLARPHRRLVGEAGRRGRTSGANSMPASRPTRADFRDAGRARAAARASASTGSSSATRSTSCSRSRMSRFARPAAQHAGVPGVREAVPERRRALGPERVLHARAGDHAAERQVAGRDALRERDEVGLDAVALQPNHAPSRPKPQITSSWMKRMSRSRADAADLLPVAVGRLDHAAGADHRLADERGDAAVVAVEQLLEVLRARPS